MNEILTVEQRLQALAELIAGWHGLVAQAGPDLVEDALALVGLLGDAWRIVDVGSGGGLPGLPLKIARPDLELTLVESSHRKAAFLIHACARLGLEGVEVVARRGEDAGRDPRLRESFDIAVARALAPMAVLAELCLPLVRVGGRLLAMKTAAASAAELGAAARAIEILGGGDVLLHPAPTRARAQGVVVEVRKLRPTPGEYPRRPGVPAHKPLGI